ncbi:MAG: TPR end-of-group domain-containing protein, partial [Sphingomonadales bacterium]
RHYWVMGNHGDRRREERVVRICRRATEIDPDYGRAWALMAIALSNLRYGFGQPVEDGVDAAERALALDPELAETYAPKARRLLEQGRYEEAKAEIAAGLRLDADSWELNKEAARILLSERKTAEAAVHLEKATSVMETDYHAWGLLLGCYQAERREEAIRPTAGKALKHVERVLAQDPSNGAAFSAGAICLVTLGQTARALEWIERALLLDPDNLNMRYNFACALAIAGDIDAALDLLEPALASAGKAMVKLATVDIDLDSLRGRPRFVAMLHAAEQRIAAQEQ